MQENDVIVLMSGGLDSTVLFYYLKDKGHHPLPLFINYGQITANKEHQTILEILPDAYKRELRVINISDVYSVSKSLMFTERDLWNSNTHDSELYIPYRNLLIFSTAVAYSQSINIKKIYSAFINTYIAKEVDASVNFLNSIEKLIDNIDNVKIELPFSNMSKVDVIELGATLNAPITKTYSCQIRKNTPCGACPNCVERLEAFKNYASKYKTN